ncbi:OmpA family protein [Hydrogenophaga sp. NH-16]|jgi:outer membrane protein OmpA-like peptidoglycan-associated protein|uniref:OmpA family protein n=1 Tax=Hydrogenophaga sp. NH-16 TaxID=2184519 RepID=UPI000FD8C5A3|nr:OmpA family protein [Hydrogenophaga sp. NH-16]
MSSQDEQQEYRVAAVVLIAVVLMAVGLAIGVAIQKVRGSGAKAAPAAVAAATAGDASAGAANGAAASAPPAAAPEAAAPAAGSDDASVVVENGVVKFYFASGKSDLAPGAVEALADAIAAGKAGQKLVISGFHDSTGDPAKNAELAKQRALAVRDALKAAGVAESGIELKKPETATGSGNNAEARRVEVVIAL